MKQYIHKIQRITVVLLMCVAVVVALPYTVSKVVAKASAETVVPRPAGLVADYAHLFSGRQSAVLEDSLRAFDAETSVQIAVVTLSDLDGRAASEVATELLTQWGVGAKGKDNGVLLLIKPRTGDSRGEVFIATGYGSEGALPDVLAGRIIDNLMMPDLAKGGYYSAAMYGVQGIMAALRGEYQGQGRGTAGNLAPRNNLFSGLFGIVVLVVMIIASIFKAKGKDNGNDDDGYGRGGSGGSRSRGGVFFPPMMGGFGGGGGGFSGGGFGGFGGGMGGGGGGGRSF